MPRDEDPGELGGWIVGPTANLREKATELHVFDAAAVDRGPLCTWRAPRILPSGFHGIFTVGDAHTAAVNFPCETASTRG